MASERTLDVQQHNPRSRAGTGNSLTVSSANSRNAQSLSMYSNTNSSDISNGSLLDLYARSPASYADTADEYRPDSMQDSPLSVNRNLNAGSDTMLQLSPKDTYPQATDMLDLDGVGTTHAVSGPQSVTHTPYATPLPPSAAVLPPGPDSDGSHYDDDPEPSSEVVDRTNPSMPGALPSAKATQQNESFVVNTPDSPPVPKRTSSAIDESANALPTTALNFGDEPVTLGQTGELEPDLSEQKRLEQELLAEAADTSRPRTLQEARERARLRKAQGGEATSMAKAESPVDEKKPSSQPSMMSASSIVTADAAARSSLDSVERPKRDPRRLSVREREIAEQSSDTSAQSDYSIESDIEDHREYDIATVPMDRIGSTGSQTKNAHHRLGLLPPALVQRPASREMDDLTDALDNAMDDLSFGSADDTLSADEDEFATPMPHPTAPVEAKELPTSSSQQLAAITGSDAQTSQTRSRSASNRTFTSPMPSPAIRTPGVQTPKATSGYGTSYFSQQQQQYLRTSASTSPVASRRQSQQPVVPKRIEVYGKHMPYPKAFASNAIINNRRGTSGERARAYAQCVNELLGLPTGLSLWMEVVQRPAMRQPPRATQVANKMSDGWGATVNTMPVRGHVRDEGSYADSVRSDMTFPMRGDGAKAKEIISVMPTMMESPSQPPPNLPYPGVMTVRSNSTQSFASSSGSSGPLAASSSALDNIGTLPRGGGNGTMTHRSVQSTGGSFFSNLGRKNSKRAGAAPPPSIAFGSVPTSGSQTSLVNATVRSRGYRTARDKSISGPVNPSTATYSAFVTAADEPGGEGPSTSATGLGLGGMDSESTASAPRLGSVSEATAAVKPSPSLSSMSGTLGKSMRSPMGPRAPGAPSPHPDTDNSPAFGSGPTFVSRLGGGSMTSSGGSHPSPTSLTSALPGLSVAHSEERGLPSPEYLHPSQSNSAQRSPRSEFAPLSPALSYHAPSSTSSHQASSSNLRSSFSYGTVRDKMRRESSPNTSIDDAAFQETLVKLTDILPDADSATLAHYLRKAKGDDLVAIGDYLQDQSLGKLPKHR